jgi:hypothetical protein
MEEIPVTLDRKMRVALAAEGSHADGSGIST